MTFSDNDMESEGIVDLGDLCAGLLNSGVTSFADSFLQPKEAPPSPPPQPPPEVSVASALPVHVRVPPSECSPALTEDDDVDDCPCWGGMLRGNASSCTPGFAAGKQHFKNKFCEACRKGIDVPASRVRAIYPAAPQALVANSLRAGFWKRSAAALGGVEVRIANNTITCDGPWLVLYRETPPVSTAPMPWQSVLPDDWVNEDGVVRLTVAKGTLVPVAELSAGKRLTPGKANEHLVGFNQGPKRQRRAPTLADIPQSELPPGGLPPSVRRGYSGTTNASSASSLSRSRASSYDGSPPLQSDSAATPQPPMIGTYALPPPVLPPSPADGTGVVNRLVSQCSVSSASSAAATPPAAHSSSRGRPIHVAAAAPVVAACASAVLSPPASASELTTRLTSTYKSAATLLEQALKPLSPVRTQLSDEAVAELTAQLNATRAAIEICAHLAAREA